MDRLGKESLGANEPEGDDDAGRRAAEKAALESIYQTALQVWAARLRWSLSEETTRELESFLSELEASMQVRP